MPDVPRDTLQILLAEYSALKSEIINRTTNGFQIVTIGVAALALVLTSASLFLLTVIAVSGRVIIRDVWKAASQVRAIEGRVNGLVGEELLQSETRFGGGLHGFWWGFWNFWPCNRWDSWPFNKTGKAPN